MNIKITIGGNDRIALILPVAAAGLVAEVMAKAKVYERDGYYSTSGWKSAEEGIVISYTEGGEFTPTHPETVKAQEEAAKKSADWYKEYQARQAAEKELSETKAALAALQSTITCQQTIPETPDDSETAEHEEEAEE